MAIKVTAPAKINLALHVTGRRDDGYHLLDSLVTFAPVGDLVTLRDGVGLSMTADGPEASGVPVDDSNLMVKAARAAGANNVQMHLVKNLPAASGIGGGSADAAAVLRGLAVLQPNGPVPSDAAVMALGADVPMCVASTPARIRGIGDRIDRVDLPPVPALLVNPRVPVSTPAVFKALTRRDNPPMPEDIPPFKDVDCLIDFLAGQRNDLEPAAKAVQPVIGDVLDAIGAQAGCRLARMSGSGATCFGLFDTESAAEAAAAAISAARPDWWVVPTVFQDCQDAAQPVVS